MSLAKLVKDWNDGKEPTLRDVAELIELAQQEVDRIGELIDDLPHYDSRIVARIDSGDKLFRFTDTDALSKYLTECNTWTNQNKN